LAFLSAATSAVDARSQTAKVLSSVRDIACTPNSMSKSAHSIKYVVVRGSAWRWLC
jgi:hypothetical protein